jgi:hypothetical protein
MNETNKQIAQLSEREQQRYRYEISRLNEEQQQQLETLVVRMVRSGASKPLDWAWSEFREGLPQWARFMIIKEMYLTARNAEGNVDAAHDFDPNIGNIYQEIVAALGEEKLKQFLVGYGKGLLNNMLGIFDEGNFDYESNDSWLLMTHDRETGTLGRPVSGLHEDFLEFDGEIADN